MVPMARLAQTQRLPTAARPICSPVAAVAAVEVAPAGLAVALAAASSVKDNSAARHRSSAAFQRSVSILLALPGTVPDRTSIRSDRAPNTAVPLAAARTLLVAQERTPGRRSMAVVAGGREAASRPATVQRAAALAALGEHG